MAFKSPSWPQLPGRQRGQAVAAAAAGNGGAGAGSGAGSGGSSSEPDSAERAFQTVQSCMELFISRKQASDLDSIVEYLPEGVIDRLLERKRAKL
jgi:hypothetical protein